ncbi:divergent polysaccharide deacetylase family protein [Consotaella aegiceratis]|uniref:divergent polysaccharide deacetylase family protein n=1 Tax=Consotaella aegiceratis TaxID=3097961 RepID=UPI002F3EF7EB
MFDDLHRPLGQTPARPRPKRPVLTWGRVGCAAALAVVIAGSAATAWLQPDLRHASYVPTPPPTAVSEKPVERDSSPLPPPPSAPIVQRGPDGILAGNAETIPLDIRDPGSLRQPAQLAHLPEQDLLEDSPYGALPIRAEDGRRPLDVYAGEPTSRMGTQIAIIVGGLGISQTGTQYAVKTLPRSVTLAFAASGNSLSRWMQDARREGHELLLQVPMEPVGYPDVSPGPHTLTAESAEAGDMDELYWSLGRMTNYVGIMNFMGARLTADREAVRALLSETAQRGLLYVDDGSSARSAAREVAVADSEPFAAADLLIDRSQQPGDIRAQLDALERIARAKGSAIGIASAFESSVDAITAWAEEASERGIDLVPVSQLALDPERR